MNIVSIITIVLLKYFERLNKSWVWVFFVVWVLGVLNLVFIYIKERGIKRTYEDCMVIYFNEKVYIFSLVLIVCKMSWFPGWGWWWVIGLPFAYAMGRVLHDHG